MRHPSRQWTFPGLFLATLVLAGFAPLAAAGSWTAELESVSVHTNGPATVQGDLAVLLMEAPAFSGEGPAMDFSLKARHVQVETDHTDAYVRTSAVYQSFASPGTPVQYQDADVEGLEHRRDHAFILFPTQGGATFTFDDGATCMSLTGSTRSTIVRESHVALSRPADSMDVSDAVAVTACDQSTLRVEGDFRIRLWDWDARLTSDGQTTKLHSGPRSPVDPMDGEILIGSADEQFLDATDATLTLTLPIDGYRLYAASTTLEAPDGFRFHDATGVLHASKDLILDHDDARVHGDLLLHAVGKAPDAPLAIGLDGDLHGVDMDGRTIPAPGAPGPMPWWPAATVALVAGIWTWQSYRRPARPRTTTASQAPDPPPARPPSAPEDLPHHAPQVHPPQGSDKERVMQVLASTRMATRHQVTTLSGLPRRRVDTILSCLLASGRISRSDLDSRSVYVVPTRAYRQCVCQDRCVRQAGALLDGEQERLWARLQACGPMNTGALERMAQEWGWPRRSLLRRLQRLVDAGLVEKFRLDVQDRRIQYYRARAPHDAAASLLVPRDRPIPASTPHRRPSRDGTRRPSVQGSTPGPDAARPELHAGAQGP